MSRSISQHSVAAIMYWPVPVESSLACGMCKIEKQVEFGRKRKISL